MSVVLITKYLLPIMSKRQKSGVINLSSLIVRFSFLIIKYKDQQK